jgi:hypothetical protein
MRLWEYTGDVTIGSQRVVGHILILALTSFVSLTLFGFLTSFCLITLASNSVCKCKKLYKNDGVYKEERLRS